MRHLPRTAQILLALILSFWLITDFLPVSVVTQWLSGVFLLLVATALLWHLWASSASTADTADGPDETSLPPEHFTGTVILVTGDSAPLFLPEQYHRETPQGWYLRVDHAEHLPRLTERLARCRPALLPRTVVLSAIIPERHTREDHFQHVLRHWLRAIAQGRTALRIPLPLLRAVWLSPPVAGIPDTRWFTLMPGDDVMTMPDGVQDGTAAAHFSRLSQHIWLDTLLAWYQRVVSPVRNGTEHPHQTPVALGVCLTPLIAEHDNLWQQQMAVHTTLLPPADNPPVLLPLPDTLLPVLPLRGTVTQRMAFWRTAGLISGVFLLLAMASSFMNNQRQVRALGDHLALYHRLSGQPPAPRLQAQTVLRADLQQLREWQRRGVPARYRLGLYQGGRLIAPVSAAVSDWTPDVQVVNSPPRQDTPMTVRLDSLSLFDSGSAVLKPGSTHVLVKALVGIRAKPGWLIVVSGHTDNTGNAQRNQWLSLKRAEAVRDWMRDTGDVPGSCLVVQGYGASRPVQTNDTAEGRAANRRVEIHLLPQADACQMPQAPSASPQESAARPFR